jgi:MFS family permease
VIVLVVVSLAQFLIALDYSIVYLALPSMARGLALAPAVTPWVVSAYAVLFAGFLIVGGRLTDRVGARPMFTGSILVFGAASGAGAAAGNGAVLLTARGVQGLAAALLQPAVLGLIGTRFPAGPSRARALSVWSAVGAGGLAAGVLLGGLLTAVSWRLTLLVNVPPAVACAAVGWVACGAGESGGFYGAIGAAGSAGAAGAAGDAGAEEGRAREPGRRVPVVASVLGTGSAVTLVLGLTFGTALGWGSAPAVGCLVAAVVLGGGFTRHEQRSRYPLIEPGLRRTRSLRAGAGAAALYMASVGSEFYLVTLLLQTMRGDSPVRAGLAFLPLAACVTVGATVTGRLVRRFGVNATLTAGFGLALVGLAWLAVTVRAGYATGLLPGLLVSGVGHGMIYTATFVLGSRDVPVRQQGTAGALLTTAQYLAGAVTLAVLTLILGRAGGYAGFTVAFGVTAAAAAAGALIAVGAPRDRAGPGEDSGRAIYGAVHQPGGTTAGR